MRKINILLFFILITICTYAQDTLHFVTTQYNIPNITDTGIFLITDTLYNTGPFTVYGPVTFQARINSTIASASQFTSSPAIPANDSIPRNQTRQMLFTIHDSIPPGGGFEIGPNLVVIWPVYNGGHAGPTDSIRINTYYYPLGIADAPLAKMYIFQTSGHLNINFGDAENIVQQVRIYNILGQGVYAQAPDRSKNIYTSGWSSGIYLCEVTTYNGDKRTFKFKLE